MTQKPKTLVLKKVNGDNEPLAGAQFTLTYTSQNHGQDGAQVSEEIQCQTVNGELKTMDGRRVSISRKGTYVLKETKAPDGNDQGQSSYMTRTPETTVFSFLTVRFSPVCSPDSGTMAAVTRLFELVTSVI